MRGFRAYLIISSLSHAKALHLNPEAIPTSRFSYPSLEGSFTLPRFPRNPLSRVEVLLGFRLAFFNLSSEFIPLQAHFKCVFKCFLYSFRGRIQVNTRLKSCETSIFCYTFHTVVLTILGSYYHAKHLTTQFYPLGIQYVL